jgi:hypothetical protein
MIFFWLPWINKLPLHTKSFVTNRDWSTKVRRCWVQNHCSYQSLLSCLKNNLMWIIACTTSHKVLHMDKDLSTRMFISYACGDAKEASELWFENSWSKMSGVISNLYWQGKKRETHSNMMEKITKVFKENMPKWSWIKLLMMVIVIQLMRKLKEI